MAEHALLSFHVQAWAADLAAATQRAGAAAAPTAAGAATSAIASPASADCSSARCGRSHQQCRQRHQLSVTQLVVDVFVTRGPHARPQPFGYDGRGDGLLYRSRSVRSPPSAAPHQRQERDGRASHLFRLGYFWCAHERVSGTRAHARLPIGRTCVLVGWPPILTCLLAPTLVSLFALPPLLAFPSTRIFHRLCLASSKIRRHRLPPCRLPPRLFLVAFGYYTSIRYPSRERTPIIHGLRISKSIRKHGNKNTKSRKTSTLPRRRHSRGPNHRWDRHGPILLPSKKS